MNNGVILVGLFLIPARHSLSVGPCHHVYPVELNVLKWENNLYINVKSYDEGASCHWVSRRIGFTNGSVTIVDFFTHIENNTVQRSEVEAWYAGTGHYIFNATQSGRNVIFHVFFLHYDPPHLDIHFVCTNDSAYINGTGILYCESQYPDPPPCNAPIIKEVTKKNGFRLEDLMIINNCDCPNIPYLRGPSKCENITLEDYFGL